MFTRASVTCPIPTITNGVAVTTDNPIIYPVNVTFECTNSSFVMVGNGTIQCLLDGTYDSHPPTCNGKADVIVRGGYLHTPPPSTRAHVELSQGDKMLLSLWI